MTCIAWDGKLLAADKQATGSGLKRTVTKIHAIAGNVLFGASGDAFAAAAMLEWVRAGRNHDDFPDLQAKEDNCTAIVVSFKKHGTAGGRVWIEVYEKSPHPVIIEDEHFASGSGRDYALAAMHLGQTATEAVKIACHFDADCGMGVDTIELMRW